MYADYLVLEDETLLSAHICSVCFYLDLLFIGISGHAIKPSPFASNQVYQFTTYRLLLVLFLKKKKLSLCVYIKGKKYLNV